MSSYEEILMNNKRRLYCRIFLVRYPQTMDCGVCFKSIEKVKSDWDLYYRCYATKHKTL